MENEELIDSGFKALQEGRAKDALEISKKIKELRHTSTFEIGARALWMLGDRQGAFDVLSEGLKIAPRLHVLWEYLGCYLSDLNQYEEAEKAFRSGMACERAPRNAYLYNFAVLRERQGRPQEALQFMEEMVLEEAISPSRARIEALRARILHGLGRLEEAQALVVEWVEVLKAREPDLTEDECEVWSQLLLVQARVERTWGLPVENILGHCRNALVLDGENTMAAFLVREINNQRSEESREYRLIVHGEEESNGVMRRFFRNFHVIADSPEEGLEFARIAEVEAAAKTLAIEESTDLGACPRSLKGLIKARRQRYFYVPGGDGS